MPEILAKLDEHNIFLDECLREFSIQRSLSHKG
jgi:hypothetical protein